MFGKKSLTREDILGANDLAIEKVSVPEWGGDVYVREMSGVERGAWETSISESSTKVEAKNVRETLAAMSICDEKGNLLFSVDDIEELGKKSVVALIRVFEKSSSLSKVTNKDVEELTDEMEKNPSGGSASA